ncbi:hypothetical protein AGOR_G00009440 [Albula goreensis]|uniref:Ig-like domain-containing protein n=1 Tax=Albula goreensis TaxID=1534307 RepID=A0A8T3E6T3_9TELE|nr:hypothetical protein AGOR_G00009440 [Albula goreensis]
MDTGLLLILQVVFWPTVPALFTVEVSKPSYKAEFLGNVTMECSFLPGDREQNVSVFWRRILPKPPMEVYKLDNWQEDLSTQDPHYRGRVRLKKEELRNGRVLLQISNLRINDAGTYQCLVEMGGADYKQTTLNVTASYEAIKKSIKANGNEVELSCEAQGYPQAVVVWTDGTGRNFTKESNVTMVTTSNQLYHITSRITVKNSNNTYKCSFVEGELLGRSAIFHIPDDILTGKSSFLAFLFVIIIGIIAICFGIMVYFRQKGSKQHIVVGTRDFLLQDDHSPACLRPDTTIDIQDCFEENSRRIENLREVLRSRYAGLISDQEVIQRCMSYCNNLLPEVLQNREGLALNVAALVPDAGKTYLLEGPSKSGKTSVALTLAYTWAQNSEWDPFAIKHYHLVVLVRCEGMKGDLFQEVMSQLNLDGTVSIRTLRETLTGSVEALLVLDGYKCGNRETDESLREFLRERQACRVLVTALQGQCDNMMDLFQTVLVLR